MIRVTVRRVGDPARLPYDSGGIRPPSFGGTGPHGVLVMRRLATLGATLIVACAAGCGAPAPPPHSVQELAGDPALLQGVVARCAADRHAAATDVECANARLAVERLGAEEESKRSGERGVEFERQREQRRVQEEQKRRAAERAQPGFDPYSSPVTGDKPEDPARP